MAGRARRGHEEPLAVRAVRDRERQLVEVAGLEDPEKKEKVAVTGLQFVVEGGHGLHDGDVVKLEEAEH